MANLAGYSDCNLQGAARGRRHHRHNADFAYNAHPGGRFLPISRGSVSCGGFSGKPLLDSRRLPHWAAFPSRLADKAQAALSQRARISPVPALPMRRCRAAINLPQAQARMPCSTDAPIGEDGGADLPPRRSLQPRWRPPRAAPFVAATAKAPSHGCRALPCRSKARQPRVLPCRPRPRCRRM